VAFKERVPVGYVSVLTYAQNRRLSVKTVRRMILSGDLVVKRGRWRWFIQANRGAKA
jgi:hypothetical protein